MPTSDVKIQNVAVSVDPTSSRMGGSFMFDLARWVESTAPTLQ
jgi:hypothetical protein